MAHGAQRIVENMALHIWGLRPGVAIPAGTQVVAVIASDTDREMLKVPAGEVSRDCFATEQGTVVLSLKSQACMVHMGALIPNNALVWLRFP